MTTTTAIEKPVGRTGSSDHSNNDNADSTDLTRSAQRLPTHKGSKHDFDKDFDFSTTTAADALVRRACHRLVPDCCGVTRATAVEDRRGIDYWIATPRGRIGLDLKLRRRDFGAGRGGSIDCVIELDSHGTGGWLLKAGGAGLILFACQDTHRFALFNATQLRTAILLNLGRWLADGRAREIETTSHRDGNQWTSRAIVVSADLLTQAIGRLEDTDCFGAANDRASP